MNIKTLILATACLTPVMTSAGAHAQTADEQDPGELTEIIVTATKTGAENLQKTPVAVSVVGGELMKSQGLSAIQDIANYVPGLTVGRNTTAPIIYLRGIGSANASAGSDPSVTQQIDGVYIARPAGQLTDFSDVERIEVLRGPQGTIYGRNAVGGTINVISRAPTKELSGRFGVSYGNFNSVATDAVISGPIAGEQVRGSVSLYYRNHDGYFHNIVPGAKDIGAANRWGVKAQLRIEPTDNIDMTTRVDYSLLDEPFENFDHILTALPFAAPLANSLVGSYRDVALNARQNIRSEAGGIAEEINFHFGDNWALKSLTAYRHLKTDLFNDSDTSELFLQHLQITEEDKQFSQEFNLQYNSDKLKAVAGLYYFGDTDEQINFVQVPPSVITPPPAAATVRAAPQVKTRSYAAFIQGSYEIIPDVRVTLGGRYTSETKSFSQNFVRTSLNPATLGFVPPPFPIIFSLERKDHAFTPKFGIDYQASPDVFLYASATRGFKSGGFNNAATAAATAGFNPEKIWAYETGIKTQMLDNRVRFNLTGFYYDYKDLQVRQLIGVANAVIRNAASVKVKGVEAEFIAKVTSDLQLTVNAAYIDATYKSFPTASVAAAYAAFVPNQNIVAGVRTFNATGNVLDGSPKFSGLAAIDYSPQIGKLELTAHVDLSWRSKAYFDASNIAFATQPGYSLLNASIGIGEDNGWRLEAFGRNLTDKKFYSFLAGNGLVPGGVVGDPRTYGIRASYKW
jgi:iron complex outermembrane receptor protein